MDEVKINYEKEIKKNKKLMKQLNEKINGLSIILFGMFVVVLFMLR